MRSRANSAVLRSNWRILIHSCLKKARMIGSLSCGRGVLLLSLITSTSVSDAVTSRTSPVSHALMTGRSRSTRPASAASQPRKQFASQYRSPRTALLGQDAEDIIGGWKLIFARDDFELFGPDP